MSPPSISAFNDGYAEEMYEAYRRDPSSVDESWRQIFHFAERLAGAAGPAAAPGPPDGALLRKVAGAASLVSAIQRYGHFAVQIDPLGSAPSGAAELHPEFHGITDEDLAELPATALGASGGGSAADVVQRVRELYCGSIGFEFEHLGEETEREWFRREVEEGEITRPLTPDEKRRLLERLTEVDGLERFLGRAYVSMKRFSIEGVDALVPMLDEVVAHAVGSGARSVVIGMAHRGRLNVLTHVMGKAYRTLLEEFEGYHPDAQATSDTGDVKYHMGLYARREIPGAGSVELELVPNPSHLEFVAPVLAGVARSKQRIAGGPPGARDEASAIPLVIHGDASFPGEGVVAETLNLSLLPAYMIGGTLHIIVNNQVGFTTNPTDARSTHYASDLAKGFEIPVVHVNADDAEGCIQAIRLGIAYRKRFRKDFLIDLVGYRRHGHNESDQPSFTQPKLYELISAHPTPRQVWAKRLAREGVVTADDAEAMDRALSDRLQATYQEMKAALPPANAPEDADDDELTPRAPEGPPVETAVRADRLIALNERLLSWPPTFKPHQTIQRTLPRRREALHSGGIDWGHAEALAFASLLTDGVNVRLTGQDVERGTFSHRHAVLHDVATGDTYVPLANLPQANAAFEIYNSALSEMAAMAFEYGFSSAAPRDLVLWEAQFGDFANVAQPVIDQFLVADRAKWRRDSSLVLLLPHGYEGQGPEHSSARLERFLQLFAEGNITVAYPTTPAQYFHVLRRHALRDDRRPLVLMQPKSLLRLPAAASSLEDLADTTFRPVLDDPAVTDRDRVQRLVFCTGKIYYDLLAAERPENVAIVRLEQVAPWPREVGDLVDRYPNVQEVVWAQEEPKNMGGWTYVQPRLRASVGTVTTLRYVGRRERASPAEGRQHAHQLEQARIVRETLTLAPAGRKRAGVR